MRRGDGAPRGAAPRTPAKESDTTKGTPPPPDPTYDDDAPELEGYESDPLTADHWSALCLAADRGELAEVAP